MNQPDFTLSASPGQVTLPAGGSASFSVTMTPLNAFSGTVAVTISDLPAGVTSTPDNFTLDQANPSRSVTLTAASNLNASSFQYSLKAVSGTLSHQYNLTASSFVPPPILRNDFVDLGYSTYNFINGVNFPGWHITIYDQSHRLFFLSLTFGNEVVAYDASTRQIVARIPVPAPFGMDFTLDGKLLLVATNTHYLYVLDTATLQVHDRIDTTLWGASGYTPIQPLSLAGNKIGFMQNLGDYLHIWNPADNSVEALGVGGWSAARSKDGTKLAYSDIAGNIGIFDVNSHTLKTATQVTGSGGFTLVPAFHPTKNQFLVTGGLNGYTRAMLLDEDLNVIHDTPAITYSATQGVQYVNGVFSPDGSRVYLEDMGARSVAILDGGTFSLLGVAQRLDPSRNYLGLYSQAMDENHLLVGASHQGLVVIDPSYISAKPIDSDLMYPGKVKSGTTTGASPVTFSYHPATGLDNAAIARSTVAFDGEPGTSVSSADSDWGYKAITATPPSHSNGVVSVGIYFPDNSWTMGANIYSFGPNIRDALTTASTAEGGPAFVTGYGFENGLTVRVGANSVQATTDGTQQFTPYSPDQNTLRAATYTMPAAVPGFADLELQSDSGTRTYPKRIHYYPALQKYPLPSAALWDGVYDGTRKLAYFTDVDKVQIFDVPGRAWLQPITLPAGVYARNLCFMALSPNADYLAVTDADNGSLITIDLASRAFRQEIPLVQVSPPSLYYHGGLPVAFASNSEVLTVAPTAMTLTDVTTGNPVWSKRAGNLDFGRQAKYLMLDGRYFVSDYGYYIDLEDALAYVLTHGWGCAGSEYTDELSLSVERRLYMNGCVINADSLVENVTNISNAEWQAGTRRGGAVWDGSGTYLLMPRDQAVDVVDPKSGRVRERITHSAQIADSTRPVILSPDGNLLVLNLGDGVAVMDISALPTGIASISPASGAEGTEITVHGTGFNTSTTVAVDGVEVLSTLMDANNLHFTAPNHAQGPVRITVRGTDGSDQLDAAFIYTSAGSVASARVQRTSTDRTGFRATPPVRLLRQPEAKINPVH